MTGTPTYASWLAMKKRCSYPKTNDYALYGGRGVTVHEPWQRSFETFLHDVGRRPSKGHSLDRIDTNGNYIPGNVRWATASEQARNRRKTKTLNRICQGCGCAFQCYSYLARRGQGKYCSYKCAHKSRDAKIEASCRLCGHTVRRKPSVLKRYNGLAFCNGKCAARYRCAHRL